MKQISCQRDTCATFKAVELNCYLAFRSNPGAVSPTENYYQSSSDKRSSLSGSEGSSPTTSNTESPSPTAVPLESPEVLSSSSLHKQFAHVSTNCAAQLQIITQPEQQHRARYQTEGSRGAVKDRSGNGFPVVKLNGYNKPTTLQVRKFTNCLSFNIQLSLTFVF